MKLYDQNGDECQMTGLPHMFYDKVAVEDLVRVKDARIAELEKALRGVLGYFHSGNDVPVERATIKADSPEIVFAKSVL